LCLQELILESTGIDITEYWALDTEQALDLLKRAYLQKVLVLPRPEDPKEGNFDCWQLLCLRGEDGASLLELKFGEHLKRTHMFVTDSCQITLPEQYLRRCASTPPTGSDETNDDPQVYIECLSRSLEFAEDSITKKIIHIERPEGIRGGGFLKYCDLLSQGYILSVSHRNMHELAMLELTMLKGFQSICYDDWMVTDKIEKYIKAHFRSGTDDAKLGFLATIVKVLKHLHPHHPCFGCSGCNILRCVSHMLHSITM